MEVLTLTYDEKLLDDLQKIEEQCFGAEQWTKKDLIQALTSRSNNLVLGIKEKNKIVADLVCIYADDYAEIATLGVLPSFRNRGYATALLREGLSQLSSQNVKHITLEVNAHNFHAIGLYEQFGFKTSGIRHNYFVGSLYDTNDALIMSLELNQQ